MMTELSLFKEFAICSVDELGDEKIRMAETTPCLFAFLKKTPSPDLSVSERSPAIAGSVYSTLDKIKA